MRIIITIYTGYFKRKGCDNILSAERFGDEVQFSILDEFQPYSVDEIEFDIAISRYPVNLEPQVLCPQRPEWSEDILDICLKHFDNKNTFWVEE